MPGPAPAWADLVDAVRDGRVHEADVDRKVLRLLLLAERVGALGRLRRRRRPTAIDGVALAHEAAVEGTVLLQQRRRSCRSPRHPLDSIAVIGHNARDARTQGGGSATVIPERVISPLDAIRARAARRARCRYALGAVVQEGVAELPLEQHDQPAHRRARA